MTFLSATLSSIKPSKTSLALLSTAAAAEVCGLAQDAELRMRSLVASGPVRLAALVSHSIQWRSDDVIARESS